MSYDPSQPDAAATPRQPNLPGEPVQTDYRTPYFDQRLHYTDDGRLLDENGCAVMMAWEEPIMARAAAAICRRGGRVLNVGFGMGYIDSHIQRHDVDEHWIIEPHPDVRRKILADGWLRKPNVRVLFARWQEVIEHLPRFDGVYIDTWNESLEPFFRHARHLLAPDGVLSFFNNPREDREGLHMMRHEYECFVDWADVEYQVFEIPAIASPDEQRADGMVYWKPEATTYYNPLITPKPPRAGG